MQETKERERMAARIKEICAKLDADAEAYTGDEPDEVAEEMHARGMALEDELRTLVNDLTKRPIRNKGDLARRSKMLMDYIDHIDIGDGPQLSPILGNLRAILAYANHGTLAGALTIITL